MFNRFSRDTYDDLNRRRARERAREQTRKVDEFNHEQNVRLIRNWSAFILITSAFALLVAVMLAWYTAGR